MRCFQDSLEFKVYVSVTGIAILLVGLDLLGQDVQDLGEALRYAAFHVTSILTTTGFVCYDYELWMPGAKFVLIALMRRTDACKLVWSKLRIYKTQLRKIIRIGLPAGLQSSMFSISNVIIQSSINSFGDVFVSGNAAVGNIEGFIFVSMNAFHQTAVNYIGQNVGAKQYRRAKQVLWTCLGCVSAVGVALSAVVCIFGRQLLGIYITDSEQAIAYGMIRLLYVCMPYILCGLMDVSTGALRGMGAAITPMMISVLGVCGIRLVWIYTIFQLPAYHTPECLYLSYAVSWLFTFLAQLLAFKLVYRRHVDKIAATQLPPR